MLYDNRDYQFYDCHVESMVWDESIKTLMLVCQYMDRGITKICLKNVNGYEYMEIMQNHTIDYVIASYDREKDATCYEIHFKGLVEVTRLWAESMAFQ